jgi:uncharacterized membrane protein
MKRMDTKFVVRSGVLVAIYILLGNARSNQPNPFIQDAVVAVNMIVPVVGGALFGRRHGLTVGLAGTALNSLSPGGSVFEALAIAPHGVMGWCAGWLGERFGAFAASLALLVGHLLNIAMFTAFGQMPVRQLGEASLWLGLASESFAGIIASTVIVSLYRLCFEMRPS